MSWSARRSARCSHRHWSCSGAGPRARRGARGPSKRLRPLALASSRDGCTSRCAAVSCLRAKMNALRQRGIARSSCFARSLRTPSVRTCTSRQPECFRLLRGRWPACSDAAKPTARPSKPSAFYATSRAGARPHGRSSCDRTRSIGANSRHGARCSMRRGNSTARHRGC